MPIPVPTIPGVAPETWSALLQALQAQGTDVATITEQGITTLSQLKQWLAAQGFELVEISEVVGYTIAKVSAVDPANTNAVSTQVVTDIATVGGAGTAVSTVTSGGPRTLGLVTKIVAVGAALSLLVSTIGAGLVTDDIQEDLITSADPYTIDGEHIPVLIDENGKTHFDENFIEAIRNRCIELGVFNTEDTPTPIPAGTFTPQPGAQSFSQWFTSFSDAWRIGANDPFDRFGITPNDYITLIENWFSDRGISTSDYVYVGNATQTSGYITFLKKNIEYTLTYQSSTYWRIQDSTYGVNGNIIQIRVHTSSNNPVITYSTSYSKGNAQIPNEGYNPAANQSGTSNDFGTPTTSTSPNTGAGEKYAAAYFRSFDITPGGGVDGLTPAADLIQAGIADTTKTISQVIPELSQNTIQTADPTDEDLTNKKNWYPVSINHDDVFTDGATEDETSTAPQGDVKPELEPEILDLVRDLIDTLTPNPTIPVGDSGDTPPENPPLTPGSGATGSNGLWSIYNPSLQAVHDFGAWLWSDTLADQFKRIFNSPIDGVIGFHMIYCTPSKGTAKNIQCGFLQSPVVSDTVANQYVEIDCGTVTIGEYYRNALDYDNTSIALYLPFIGIVPLDTNVVMGSDISILYRIDVLTGTCLAQVTVEKENSTAVMYAFDGNCSVQIPLTATTYTGMVGALLGGLSASVSFMAGDMFHAVTGAMSAMSSAMGGKSGVKQSGTMGANAGALGIRKPYVIITHPMTAMPAGFEGVRGLPSTELVTLGSMSGFTSVRDVHLEGIPATAEEINEIKELLAEGVIL